MSMATNLVDAISERITERFKSKPNIFAMFRELDTGPEEWFRVEILDVLSSLKEIETKSTNQEYKNITGRPDFVLNHGGKEYVVELKVLPTDRNYKTGYQRFCAGKSNRADFDALENDEVDLVIYIHWPLRDDFVETSNKLRDRYRVTCHKAELIKCNGLEVTVSFWIAGDGN